MRGWIVAAICGLGLAIIGKTPSPDTAPVAAVDPPDLVARVSHAVQRQHDVRFDITMTGAGATHAHVTGGYHFTHRFRADVRATITAPGRRGDPQRTAFVAVGRYGYLRPAPDARWRRFPRNDDVSVTRYVRPLVLEIARALDAVHDWRLLADGGRLHKAGELSDSRHEIGYRSDVKVHKALLGTTDGGHAMFVDIANRGVKRIGYTVWVDNSRLPVQALVTIRYSGRDVHIKANYRHWGDRVRIVAPTNAVAG